MGRVARIRCGRGPRRRYSVLHHFQLFVVEAAVLNFSLSMFLSEPLPPTLLAAHASPSPVWAQKYDFDCESIPPPPLRTIPVRDFDSFALLFGFVSFLRNGVKI